MKKCTVFIPCEGRALESSLTFSLSFRALECERYELAVNTCINEFLVSLNNYCTALRGHRRRSQLSLRSAGGLGLRVRFHGTLALSRERVRLHLCGRVHAMRRRHLLGQLSAHLQRWRRVIRLSKFGHALALLAKLMLLLALALLARGSGRGGSRILRYRGWR